MAYRLGGDSKLIERNLSVIETVLNCYDTLDDDDFEWDRDFHLHHRSALEFVRDQLNDAQRAELDKVDAHWQENAEAFNRAFAVEHHQHKPKVALVGFVVDEGGETPPIPQGHWWWKPIEKQENNND